LTSRISESWHNELAVAAAGMGLVTRVTPVQTALQAAIGSAHNYIFTALTCPGDDVRTFPRLGAQVKLNTWKKQFTPLARPRSHPPLGARREGRLSVTFDPNPQVVQRGEINVQSGYTFDDNEPVHPNFSGRTLYARGLKIIGSKRTPAACGQPRHRCHKFVVADEIKGERWLIV
jgi:hypothetical protein